MGQETEPRVKLIAVLLFRDAPERSLERLEARFSPADFRGPPHPFTHTNYYEGEMGAGLSRVIVSFSELVAPPFLVEARLAAHELEQALSSGGRRTVNVDMGYLDLHKLVLASFKSRGNKLYLERGVWADLTLIFTGGAFKPLPWTFPDFSDGTYHADLLAVRDLLKKQLREPAPP